MSIDVDLVNKIEKLVYTENQRTGKITFSDKNVKCCSLQLGSIEHIFKNRDKVAYVYRKHIIFYHKHTGRGFVVDKYNNQIPCRVKLEDVYKKGE